ncbi:MAG: HAMP domain-containing histidine kinase [Moraxellaceae bacterium]|nr:HAMP domain-containing histidine kinase [Moraxellaceae bacterium]
MHLFRFRSIFVRLFVSVMLALVLFTIAMIVLTKVLQDNNNSIRSEILAGQVVEQINPFLNELNDAPNRLQARYTLAVIKKSLDIFDESLDAKMGLYNIDGKLLIQTEGSDLAKKLPQPPSWFAQTFPTLAGVPPTTSARILSPTGYILFLEPRQLPKKNALTAMFNLFTGTLLLFIIMAIALWWISHSITWRINHMSKRMLELGEGDFSVRVPVKGVDEISTLANGFNKSAEKIEQLINANNLLLAHASHEFRTPITRIRLQVEMMDMIANNLPENMQAMFLKRANAINKDLTGLNDLIESILLVSRLDAGHAIQQVETIDIYELVSQEAQHYAEATFIGEPLKMQGQAKLLIHVIRNLLNNSMIHGTPPINVYLYGANDKETASDIPTRLLNPQQNIVPVQSDNPHALDNYLFIEENQETTEKKYGKLNNKQIVNCTKTPKNPSKFLQIRNKLPSRQKAKTSQTQETGYPYLALAVIDQGTGIEEEKRADIFSPFVRLNQEKKGSGLGLSLVAQIVEAHQGTIVTDVWEGHTRFLVVLPREQETAED